MIGNPRLRFNAQPIIQRNVFADAPFVVSVDAKVAGIDRRRRIARRDVVLRRRIVLIVRQRRDGRRSIRRRRIGESAVIPAAAEIRIAVSVVAPAQTNKVFAHPE